MEPNFKNGKLYITKDKKLVVICSKDSFSESSFAGYVQSSEHASIDVGHYREGWDGFNFNEKIDKTKYFKDVVINLTEKITTYYRIYCDKPLTITIVTKPKIKPYYKIDSEFGCPDYDICTEISKEDFAFAYELVMNQSLKL